MGLLNGRISGLDFSPLCLLLSVVFSSGCYSGAGHYYNANSLPVKGQVVMSLEQMSSEQKQAARADRAAGAIMGFLIGDALGLGTHWYYDMDALHRDHGAWVDNYVDPKPDSDHMFAQVSQYRYKLGLRAGDVSQTGQVYIMLLDSIVSQKGFEPSDFLHRLDEFFTELNGESYNGRYTESLIRILWQNRRDGLAWDSPGMATGQDTSDGAQLLVLLAALYSDPETLAVQGDKLLKVMFNDASTRGNQLAYALVVQGLINGIAVDDINTYMRGLAKNTTIYGLVGGYDRFLTPGYGAVAQRQDLVKVKEPKYISHVFGMDCQLMHLVPAAYYLLYRFPEGFEMATLSASNGGGNNMARAALTGALAGAANGLHSVPERFFTGLKDNDQLTEKARKVAAMVN